MKNIKFGFEESNGYAICHANASINKVKYFFLIIFNMK